MLSLVCLLLCRSIRRPHQEPTAPARRLALTGTGLQGFQHVDRPSEWTAPIVVVVQLPFGGDGGVLSAKPITDLDALLVMLGSAMMHGW